MTKAEELDNEQVGERPLRIALEITHDCNLRCQHCSITYGQNMTQLTVNNWKDVLSQASDIGLAYVTFSGGEPLLHPQLIELIAYAVEQPGIDKVNMATNGTLATDVVVSELQALGLSGVGISIDHPHPEVHDDFRGVQGAWAETTKAVQRFAASKSIQVGVHPVITTLNYNHMAEMVDLAASLGAAIFSTQRFLPVGRGALSMELVPTREHMRIALETLSEQKQKRAGDIQVLIGDPLKVLVDPVYRQQFGHYASGPFCLGCTAGVADCAVDAVGNVKGCLHSCTAHGSVRKNTLMEIWLSSPIMGSLRCRNNLRGKCRSCSYRQICGGCREAANLINGSYLAEDPLCWLPDTNGQADSEMVAGEAVR